MFHTKKDTNFTNSEELHILKKITMLLSKARRAWFSSTEKDVPFNCHSVARALVNYLQNECITLSVTDGLKLGFGIDEDRNPTGLQKLPHSWIVLRNRNGNIIDPYPNGIISLSPLLIPISSQFSPYGGNMYHEVDISDYVDQETLHARTIYLLDLFRKADAM